MAKKTTKKGAKAALGKGPKFDRNWMTNPNNPSNSPYWTPPYIEVDLTYASMLFMDEKGTPIKDEFLYTGSKVKANGEFSRLNIDDTGIVEDLQKAIDEVIRKHTKLKPHDKTTTIEPKDGK